MSELGAKMDFWQNSGLHEPWLQWIKALQLKRFKSFTLVLLVRFVAQYGGSCGVAVETAGRRMALQMEGRLKDTLERLKLRDQTSAAAGNSAGNSNHLEAMVQQLLSAARTQASRLAKLETSCFSSPGAGMGMNSKTGSQLPDGGVAGHRVQEVTSQEVALDGAVAALQQMRVELGEVLRSSRQRYLPAGKISILPAAICVSVFTCCFLFLCIRLHLSQQCQTNNLPPLIFLLPWVDTFRSRFT